jgi:hypothetical protein
MDQTIKLLNSFYNVDLNVDANQYEIIHSFFKEYCSDEKMADDYTEILFRISTITDIDALELLNSFVGLDSMKIALTLCYYLNTINENKVVLFGVSDVLTPNEKVQRNIVL